jgi:hypothetical protein
MLCGLPNVFSFGIQVLLNIFLTDAYLYLILIQPGSEKSVNYRGLFSFDLAFTRCKLTSPGIWLMRNRALRFQKSAQYGAATLRKSESCLTENPLPRALYAAWNRKLTGILTGAGPHCRPQFAVLFSRLRGV